MVSEYDVARLLEIERQALAEGCNIGSVPEAPVWLVNQRAEIVERERGLLRAALQKIVDTDPSCDYDAAEELRAIARDALKCGTNLE